jgi:Ca-activated chloride channel family protein
VVVDRPDARTAVVKFSTPQLATDKDFRLYYAPSTEDVALRLLAHRAPGEEEGYFMLLARPDDELEQGKVLPKEVVFALDTSGSMAGEKMEQARKALTFCLGQLNPNDRFNLVTFSTEVRALSEKTLLDAGKENIKKALAAVEMLEATGGTAIDEALRTALAMDFRPDQSVAKLVIFLTDGLPSIGTTDTVSILKGAASGNAQAKARIFTFGVGADVNTHLMDRLSRDAEGWSSYVAPKEDLELKLSDFYARVKNPVMTNVALDFGAESKVGSLYPRKIPALFKGSEILLFGRFKGEGPAEVKLRGLVSGQEKEIRLNFSWPKEERENDFLPRVWAMRKIGHLLEEVRLRGTNPETIEEIVALAQRHGIVTPYTSQLVLEPGMTAPIDQWRRGIPEPMARPAVPAPAKAAGVAFDGLKAAEEKARKEALDVAHFAGQTNNGEAALALAETERLLKDAKNDLQSALGPMTADAPAEGRRADSEAAARALRAKAFAKGGGAAGEEADRLAVAQELTVKQAGGRTFYLREGAWVDSNFKAGGKVTILKAFSKEYFELLKQRPELGAVLALGGRIFVVAGEVSYQIEPEEK